VPHSVKPAYPEAPRRSQSPHRPNDNCPAGASSSVISPPDVLRDLVRQTTGLTKRPFGVDLIGDFVTDKHISVLIEERVALAIFFWTLPTVGHVERFKWAGIKVWMQIGRVAEAEQAVALDADALIVRGAEAADTIGPRHPL
jgi:NAD(P)H-dependent flavin oxidoreductase YrpB (nitropropane dioxygenase family)